LLRLIAGPGKGAVMKLKLLLATTAIALSLCAVAQPTRAPMQVDRDPAVVNDRMQVDRDPAVAKEKNPESSASGGSSAAPKPGTFGEQPPAVSPAGSSSERTAEPKENGEDKHDKPTGEKPKD
jgi:hypothetical protein